MLCQFLICPDVPALKDCLSQICQFLFQAGGKNCQAHYLDETDIFLLNMVQFLMGMVHAQRELFGGDIIAQHQIQFKHIAVLARNRRNGIVGFSVRLRIDKCRFIGIFSPGLQHNIRQIDESVAVLSPKPQHRHGPEYNACLHIFKAFHLEMLFNRCLSHGKGVMPALEMIVA